MKPSRPPLVAIVMGSPSDGEIMSHAARILDDLGVPNETVIASAHRTPDRVREFALEARGRGIEVIIAGAGWAAHLAGVIAGFTDLPVVAVPISSSALKGMDALLSSVMMPPGVPVAVMAVDGAKNAGLFAAQILALKHPDVRENLSAFRTEMTRKALGNTPL